MDDETIKDIVAELSKGLLGRSFGKLFQLTRASLAIDFRTQDSSYLFISVEPAQPRLYMIKRRVRDLEKQSLPLSTFTQVLRKHLGGATLLAITKDEGDRIVRLTFSARDEMGNTLGRTLVAQLTGRTANLLLLDDRGFILDMMRNPRGIGPQPGDPYAPPPAQAAQASAHAPTIARAAFANLSEAADQHYLGQESERLFDARAANARQRLRKEMDQRKRLQRKLEGDLVGHGDADEHKRVGDLLLANLGTAERHGETVTLTDYYAPDTPRIELQVEEHKSLQEEAVQRFARYTKARRATQEIARRMETLLNELEMIHAQQSELERIIAERDEEALAAFFEEGKSGAARPKRGGPPRGPKPALGVQGARRYLSSDGYEILVGRAARDNDHLTFRIARPHDLWLHAADYPGSHVVVRNPNRAEIPQRTIIEAAQLAANYSQARRDAKVDVHYTPRKFLSKPKGAALGLVRMSSFRSITVEPTESVERI
jgi:predicted ribosome quality control (RQC) complex YloA/Tae2 family protein